MRDQMNFDPKKHREKKMDSSVQMMLREATADANITVSKLP